MLEGLSILACGPMNHSWSCVNSTYCALESMVQIVSAHACATQSSVKASKRVLCKSSDPSPYYYAVPDSSCLNSLILSVSLITSSTQRPHWAALGLLPPALWAVNSLQSVNWAYLFHFPFLKALACIDCHLLTEKHCFMYFAQFFSCLL